MRSTIVRNELAVGGFLVLAVAVAAMAGVVKTRERGLLGATTIRFAVPHGSGLQPGAPVLMQGVQVGEVADITLSTDHQVLVTCAVAPRWRDFVRKDSQAMVVEPPLIGSTKVELSPGAETQAAAEGQELPGKIQGSLGDQVSSIQAKVDGVVARVDSFVNTANDTLAIVQRVVERVEKGDGLAGRIVNDPALAQDVKDTLARMNRLVEAIDRGEGVLGMAVSDRELAGDLKETAADFRRIVDQIEAGEGSLGKLLKDSSLVDETTGLIRDARGALAKLEELNEQTKVSVQKVGTLLDTANASMGKLDGLVGSADRVAGELADTLHRVNQGEGTVAALLNDDSVYRETRSLLKELRESVEDLREQAPINSFLGVVFSAF